MSYYNEPTLTNETNNICNTEAVSNFLTNLVRPEFIEFREGFRPVPSKADSACADIRTSIQSGLPKKAFESFIYYERIRTIYINGKKFQPERQEHQDDFNLRILELMHSSYYIVEDEYKARIIAPNQSLKFGTGFAISLPKLIEPFLAVYKIYSRSGMGINCNLTITNDVGIIDKGYHDEIIVSLENTSDYYHIITDGARVAQGEYGIVINQGIWKSEDVVVEKFTSDYERGGGIGSSGTL
jgi:dUTPase